MAETYVLLVYATFDVNSHATTLSNNNNKETGQASKKKEFNRSNEIYLSRYHLIKILKKF